MANPNTPTILAPNGGESFFSGSIIPISWSLPQPDSTDGRPVKVEIYFTDIYTTKQEPDWQQIAVISDSDTSYQWKSPLAIHSSKCRVAIRTRNSRGERSQFSISAANFLITHQKLATPTVISPTNGGRYDKYIEIAPNIPLGTYSQRSMYQIYYSSVSAKIPSSLIAQNIPVGTASVIWNIIDVPPANDYVIEIYVEDDDNNKSDSLLIENVTIAHEGFFLIDTTPPVASVIINNGDEFTQFQDVTLSIVSYDATTGVQSMQIIEANSQPANESLPEPPSSNLPFTLSTGDGTKVVELLLQDFGANRNTNVIQRVFETILEQPSVKIVDIALDATSTAWVLTQGVGNNNLYSIVEYPQIVYTFADTIIPTAVGVFNSITYVGTKNAANRGTLYSYSGALTVSTIYTFTDSDSVINCIQAQGALMYLGFENGNVYSFDGAVLVNIATLPNPISSLMSDGNSLYLAMENDDNVYIYNGSNFVQTGV